MSGKTDKVLYIMKLHPVVLFLLSFSTLIGGEKPEVDSIIARARSFVGTETQLKQLVTVQVWGRVIPHDPKLPPAKLKMVARKPLSQRLELTVDDIVETTILNGKAGCVIRRNLDAKGHHMRPLSEPELRRIQATTRDLFSFYKPCIEVGEVVELVGEEMRAGELCYRLVYSSPKGLSAQRFFSVESGRLVSTIESNGVESIGLGEQVVDGLSFPERIEFFQDGLILHTVELERIMVNQPLKLRTFNMPRRVVVPRSGS